MTIQKTLLAVALAAPVAIGFIAPANAQVSNIATVSELSVIANTKALVGANQQIATTYKAAIDQTNARVTALQTEAKPLIAQIDTNHDGQLSPAERDAAQKANNPAVAKLQTAEENAQRDIARIQGPMIIARAFAAEQILMQYDGALSRVVTAKKVAMLIQPEAVLYAPEAADLTNAVTAELDKVLPTVPITPPAGWQPRQGTMVFLQQYDQAVQQQAQQQAAAPRPAPAGQPQPAPTR